MTTHAPVVLALLGALVLMAGGCGLLVDPALEPSECLRSADCAGGLACVDGRCAVDPRDLAAGAPGSDTGDGAAGAAVEAPPFTVEP